MAGNKAEHKTSRLLKVYLSSSLLYLISQELLNVFIFYFRHDIVLETFVGGPAYFASPIISSILIVLTFIVLKAFYEREKEHYLLHGLAWAVLFFPQLVPPFLYGLNIIYTVWVFVMSTVVVGVVAFHDLILFDVRRVPKDKEKFVYTDLRFYLDKLSIAWLALASVLAIAMTILWTAPQYSFEMKYSERAFWAVYMVFSFLTVTALVVIFIVYPIFQRLRELREIMLRAEAPVKPEEF